MGVVDFLGQRQSILTSPHSLRRKAKTPQRVGCNRQACRCAGHTLAWREGHRILICLSISRRSKRGTSSWRACMRMAGITGPKPCGRLSEVPLPNLQQWMAAAPTLSLKRRNYGCHAHYEREQASGWQLRHCLVAQDTMFMLPCAVLTALHNSRPSPSRTTYRSPSSLWMLTTTIPSGKPSSTSWPAVIPYLACCYVE
jgi:hypothetical protein